MQEIDSILNKTRSQISTVEAPDHILTRAKQQFENLRDVATPKFIWSTTIATVALLLFNVYVVGQHHNSNSQAFDQNIETEEVMIISSNQLYADE